MKATLITLILLLTFTGCQDQETQKKMQAAHDAEVAAQARAEVLAEISAAAQTSPADPQHEKLKQMGINIHNDVISIDTNKSKLFLKAFSDKMAKHMQKTSDDLRKGIIETKEAGIDINNEHIHIDLNKTRNFLEEWGKNIHTIVEEINHVTEELDINTSR